ncbi:MAG: hypothetical protein WD316_01225 [Phycisphaeraceae bacterium]
MRERESARAKGAHEWYHQVNTTPTKLGNRIAYVLRKLDHHAQHEVTLKSRHSSVRADVHMRRDILPPQVIVEIKAFSAENTMPSTVRDAIKTTLRRHAQFGGYLGRT